MRYTSYVTLFFTKSWGISKCLYIRRFMVCCLLKLLLHCVGQLIKMNINFMWKCSKNHHRSLAAWSSLASSHSGISQQKLMWHFCYNAMLMKFHWISSSVVLGLPHLCIPITQLILVWCWNIQIIFWSMISLHLNFFTVSGTRGSFTSGVGSNGPEIHPIFVFCTYLDPYIDIRHTTYQEFASPFRSPYRYMRDESYDWTALLWFSIFFESNWSLQTLSVHSNLK